MSDLKIISNIKKHKVDEFVYNNPNASIFQTTAMEEVYSRNVGAKPLGLATINEETGEIISYLLAKILEEKPGLLGNLSRHSTIRGGPIFLDNDEGIKSVELLLSHYNKFIKKNAIYSRIYPLKNIPQINSVFSETGYIPEVWNNFLIDLNEPKDVLWNNLKKSKKYGVRKAKNNGLTFREGVEKEDVLIFYELISERFALRKNPLEDVSNFKAVFDILVPKGLAKFFFVEYNDIPISTTLILLYKGEMYDWYNGTNSKYLNYSPNDFLIWSVLEWGKDNGFYLFDFGGGGTKDDRNSGWVKFKERFGGKLVNYGRYTKTHQPIKLKFAEKGYKIYKYVL